MNKSALFSVYNLAARSDKLNRKVVNRALGIIQQGLDIKPEYHTTIQSCCCPSRIQPCKHRVALMMVKRANQQEQNVTLVNGRYYVAEFKRHIQACKVGLKEYQSGTPEYNRISAVLADCREQLKYWQTVIKNNTK